MWPEYTILWVYLEIAMIRQKLEELLRSFDSNVRNVVAEVILLEYSRLDTKKPKGIYDEIRKIIEKEVRRDEA